MENFQTIERDMKKKKKRNVINELTIERSVSKADSKRACGLDGWMDGHAPLLLAEGGKST